MFALAPCHGEVADGVICFFIFGPRLCSLLLRGIRAHKPLRLVSFVTRTQVAAAAAAAAAVILLVSVKLQKRHGLL